MRLFNQLIKEFFSSILIFIQNSNGFYLYASTEGLNISKASVLLWRQLFINEGSEYLNAVRFLEQWIIFAMESD